MFSFIFKNFDPSWCIPLKNKLSETTTKDFSNILTTSKRSPLKIESVRSKDWNNSVFLNFLKIKILQHYSRYTDRGPSVVELVIRTVRN